jgi:replication-associated recombination protein RarA
MAYDLKTKRGYDFYEVASALQKSVRRNLPDMAGYFALELFHSGFGEYVWKRLLTISAEDCHGLITREIKALQESYILVNRKRPKGELPKGRIFISKAVLILCAAPKNRDADHLQNLIYDKRSIGEDRIREFIDSIEINRDRIPVPEFAYDVHTKKGRRMGMTKHDFFRQEQRALKPKSQYSLFDSLVQ